MYYIYFFRFIWCCNAWCILDMQVPVPMSPTAFLAAANEELKTRIGNISLGNGISHQEALRQQQRSAEFRRQMREMLGVFRCSIWAGLGPTRQQTSFTVWFSSKWDPGRTWSHPEHAAAGHCDTSGAKSKRLTNLMVMGASRCWKRWSWCCLHRSVFGNCIANCCLMLWLHVPSFVIFLWFYSQVSQGNLWFPNLRISRWLHWFHMCQTLESR